MHALVAQSGASQSAATNAVVWVVVLMAAVLGGAIAILLLRRRLLSRDAPGAADGSMIDQMRAMRDRGQMTDEEFDRLRKAMARKAAQRRAAEAHPPPRRHGAPPNAP
ncbi:MAG TPA: SHOCT domain-containing protein [Phycisphaerales bacterium]|nr:SHOCT domain-containing protein [Phycisphaerales bacterium]